jgi:hypothetical protein
MSWRHTPGLGVHNDVRSGISDDISTGRWGGKRLKGKTLESPDKADYKEVQASILLEKGLHEVETYSHPGEDERDPNPDSSGDGQFLFCLQVVAEGDTEEDNGYRHKHDSERRWALHRHPHVVTLIRGAFIPTMLSTAWQSTTRLL